MEEAAAARVVCQHEERLEGAAPSHLKSTGAQAHPFSAPQRECALSAQQKHVPCKAGPIGNEPRDSPTLSKAAML